MQAAAARTKSTGRCAIVILRSAGSNLSSSARPASEPKAQDKEHDE